MVLLYFWPYSLLSYLQIAKGSKRPEKVLIIEYFFSVYTVYQTSEYPFRALWLATQAQDIHWIIY